MHSQFEQIHIRKLISAEGVPTTNEIALPTKENLIKGFTEFLSQAGVGDTALFFPGTG
ncbi:MAG: hypothetical protein IPN20_03710 [Haliscomenobacter sp.]|nr:hypothetical protein [Haliscomenobacter sp.]